MPEKDVNIKVRATDESSPVLEKNIGLFGRLGEAARKANAEARQSGDTSIERLLKGGGALGLATLGGEMLTQFAEKASELNKQFREGKIDSTGYAVGLAEGIPVIGKFVEAGQTIREALTGEKAQIERINEEIKIGNEFMQRRIEYSKEYNATLATMKDYTSAEGRGAEVAGLTGTAREKKLLDIQQANEQETRDRELGEKRKALLKGQVDASQPLRDQLKAAEDAIQGIENNASKRLGRYLTDKTVGGHYLLHKDDEEEADLRSTVKNLRGQLDTLGQGNQGNVAKFEAEAAAGDAAQKAKFKADQDALDKKIGEERAATAAESEQKVSDIQEKAGEQRLRDQGKFRQADLAAIKQGYDDKVTAENEALRKSILADPGNEKALRKQSADRLAAFGVDRDQQIADANVTNDDADAERRRDLLGLKKQSMELDAADGIQGASLEAKKYAIAEKFAGLRIDLDKKIRTASNAGEKAQLQKIEDALGTQEEGAIANLFKGKREFLNAKLEGGQGSQLLGVAASTREQNDPNRQLISSMQQHAREIREAIINELPNTFAQALLHFFGVGMTSGGKP